jgi:ATP-dependent DNA helicase 2 subunit 1
VIILPFADDIRHVPFKVATPESEHIDIARKIIEKLQVSYDPLAFSNPVLDKLYSYLNALALEKEDLELIKNNMIPDVEDIFHKSGMYIAEFNHSIKEKCGDSIEPAPKKATKRKAEDQETVTLTKEIIYDMIEKNTLQKLTIAQLIAFLKTIGLKPESRKKSDLLSQVERIFSE